jgi:hypothetical protein
LLKSRADGPLEQDPFGDGEQFRDPEEEKSRRQWSAVFILVMGGLILVRATIEFIRLRRTRAMIGSIPLRWGI